jgi:CheY-like chemotaxis protein
MRVLVVEDEGLIALMLEDMIEDMGCDVAYSAGSVAQALAWIERDGRTDVALLDVNLGGETVFPVAEALRARGIPFVFATGYGDGHDPRFGDAPNLGKPIVPARLEQVLKQLGG